VIVRPAQTEIIKKYLVAPKILSSVEFRHFADSDTTLPEIQTRWEMNAYCYSIEPYLGYKLIMNSKL